MFCLAWIFLCQRWVCKHCVRTVCLQTRLWRYFKIYREHFATMLAQGKPSVNWAKFVDRIGETVQGSTAIYGDYPCDPRCKCARSLHSEQPPPCILCEFPPVSWNMDGIFFFFCQVLQRVALASWDAVLPTIWAVSGRLRIGSWMIHHFGVPNLWVFIF